VNEIAGTEGSHELIERVARRIEQRGLVAPAVLFLETMKPLSFLGGQMLYLAEPILGQSAADYACLLEDAGSVDRLLARLESRRSAPSQQDE
jgi:hypothetical protein